MNIITNIDIKEVTKPIVYVVWRNYTTISMDYNRNGLVVYRSY